MARKRKRKGNYPKRRPPLDERHYRAIEMLTRVPRMNYEEIAAELGVDRRTLYRWRERPDFQRAYKELSRAVAKAKFKHMKADMLSYALCGETGVVTWFFEKSGYLA
ncbi:phBC6A51 family helix-turn-helix protein [Paenibacillus sp. YN15]|uniref:phBC6A51 family helix-turn-helix protein n=1 Tax=Paenibacillus sp. YN15 TaxID=1742774 RepID=UPI000DCB8FF2|nr:phBC6A51 family helix-turn-helix protein [Paenibacillus sp. YN15]RAV03036.1 hypothetical protein DQG13_08230 [Paenibacillus sp. YN15]